MTVSLDDQPLDAASAVAKQQRRQPDPMSEATQQALHTRMGRNLLLFSQIEGCLRHVLTFTPADGNAKDADALQQFMAKVHHKTLGLIGRQLTESMGASELEGFRAYLDAVVHQRNQLVHHFLGQPGIDLTENGGRTGIRWLDEQHAFCEPMLRFSINLLTICLHGRQRGAVPEDADEPAVMRNPLPKAIL
jgi:hypothetical protein